MFILTDIRMKGNVVNQFSSQQRECNSLRIVLNIVNNFFKARISIKHMNNGLRRIFQQLDV